MHALRTAIVAALASVLPATGVLAQENPSPIDSLRPLVGSYVAASKDVMKVRGCPVAFQDPAYVARQKRLGSAMQYILGRIYSWDEYKVEGQEFNCIVLTQPSYRVLDDDEARVFLLARTGQADAASTHPSRSVPTSVDPAATGPTIEVTGEEQDPGLHRKVDVHPMPSSSIEAPKH